GVHPATRRRRRGRPPGQRAPGQVQDHRHRRSSRDPFHHRDRAVPVVQGRRSMGGRAGTQGPSPVPVVPARWRDVRGAAAPAAVRCAEAVAVRRDPFPGGAMKRALSTALAVLAVVPAACAGPKPKLDFGGKAVPINVAFGKPKDGEPGSVAGPSTVEVVPGAIGVVPVPRPAVSRPAGSAAPPTTATPPTTVDFGSAAPPSDPCPEAGPFAFPRADADTQVRAVAPEGDYPFRVRASTTINGNKASSEGEF